MNRRLVMIACRGRHFALWWGPCGLVILWPLALPSAARPYASLTLPRRSGGTLAARLGPALFVYQGKP